MVSDRMIQSIYYSFLLVPLPVINLMLRQSDFPRDKCSTVDVVVTWNEVRIAFIVLCLWSIIATIITSSSYNSICNQSQCHYWSNDTSKLFTT